MSSVLSLFASSFYIVPASLPSGFNLMFVFNDDLCYDICPFVRVMCSVPSLLLFSSRYAVTVTIVCSHDIFNSMCCTVSLSEVNEDESRTLIFLNFVYDFIMAVFTLPIHRYPISDHMFVDLSNALASSLLNLYCQPAYHLALYAEHS